MQSERSLEWWERRSGQASDFDSNPRRSYYKFLRAVYGMEALEAWRRSGGWIPEFPGDGAMRCSHCGSEVRTQVKSAALVWCPSTRRMVPCYANRESASQEGAK